MEIPKVSFLCWLKADHTESKQWRLSHYLGNKFNWQQAAYSRRGHFCGIFYHALNCYGRTCFVTFPTPPDYRHEPLWKRQPKVNKESGIAILLAIDHLYNRTFKNIHTGKKIYANCIVKKTRKENFDLKLTRNLRISRGLPAFFKQFWLHFKKNFK